MESPQYHTGLLPEASGLQGGQFRLNSHLEERHETTLQLLVRDDGVQSCESFLNCFSTLPAFQGSSHPPPPPQFFQAQRTWIESELYVMVP